MFSFRGFMQTIGVSLIVVIIYSFIIGFFNLMSVEGVVFSIFFVSYISVGILAPLWNKRTPYFASFLSAVVITVINLLFSIFVLRIPVLVDPNVVNDNLVSSVVLTMVTAFLFIQINNRIERNNYDKN